MKAPHLHLSSHIPAIEFSQGNAVSLADLHLPTGFVIISAVVRLLIAEFGVVPRRENWEIVLAPSD